MKRIFSARTATGVLARVAFLGAVVITLNTAPMSFDPVGGSGSANAKENKHKSKPGKNRKHVSKGTYAARLAASLDRTSERAPARRLQ